MVKGDSTGGDILIVEDDTALALAVAEALKEEGFKVVTSANGREGLDRLEEGLRPALILLDLSMPVMDGSEFRAHQQERPQLAWIPVVVFSATGDMGAQVRRLQPAGVLAKPFTVDALLRVIEGVLRA